MSGATPIRKTSTHYFFRLSDPRCENFLRGWVGGLAQAEATNKMREWLGDQGEAKLADWDISRDAPYFGFEIPDSPGNYWYVWFDAPIGYIASTAEWCQREGESLDRWWRGDDVEIHHFIGKDITYFHSLFWPAMLKTAGFSLPKVSAKPLRTP